MERWNPAMQAALAEAAKCVDDVPVGAVPSMANQPPLVPTVGTVPPAVLNAPAAVRLASSVPIV